MELIKLFRMLKNKSSIIITISRLLEVDIGVAKGHPRDHVSADSDGQNGSSRGEFFKKHGLSDILGQIADVKRGHRV